MRTKLKLVNVKMTEQRLAQLNKVAKEVGCSLSAVIRQAVRFSLDKHHAALIAALKEAA